MIRQEDIREAAVHLCSELSPVLLHDSIASKSTWDAGLETGKALELFSLCAVAHIAKQVGYCISLPSLLAANPDLFYLRNIIPRPHGAQAGHDATALDYLPLRERFIGAMTPKIILSKPDGSHLSLFREGMPLHAIHSACSGIKPPLDRPDIVISEGIVTLDDGFDKELPFSFSCREGTSEGVLRIMDSNTIPLKRYRHALPCGVRVNGIIECSIGKGRDIADEQRSRYLEIYNCTPKPATALINGRPTTSNSYDVRIDIDLKENTGDDLITSICAGLRLFLAKIEHRLSL